MTDQLDEIGDSVAGVMTRMKCSDYTLLGTSVTECVGYHADTVVSVTKDKNGRVRVVRSAWAPVSHDVDAEIRTTIASYSRRLGAGRVVCPVANAFGMRWERKGYFVIVYPDPSRGQIVRKLQADTSYQSSSCPGLPD
jgi:hypothetical protein